MLTNFQTPTSNAIAPTSPPLIICPNSVADMVESWTNKGCNHTLMLEKIRDYHSVALPVCDMNGKSLTKIPGSQTIKNWESASELQMSKVSAVAGRGR
jgi:hypothetical protein